MDLDGCGGSGKSWGRENYNQNILYIFKNKTKKKKILRYHSLYLTYFQCSQFQCFFILPFYILISLFNFKMKNSRLYRLCVETPGTACGVEVLAQQYEAGLPTFTILLLQGVKSGHGALRVSPFPPSPAEPYCSPWPLYFCPHLSTPTLIIPTDLGVIWL